MKYGFKTYSSILVAVTIDPTTRTPMRPSTVRAANAELVLAHLAGGEATTRAELAEQTSLTPQALGPILADLVDAGSVIEEPSLRSGPGRPPSAYRLDPLSALTIEVLIRFADFHVMVTDALGQTIGAERHRHKPGPTPRRLAKRVVTIAQRLIAPLGATFGVSSSLVVTVEGVVDEQRQIVVQSPAWKAAHVDLVALFRDLLDESVTVTVMSNERALALGALDLIDARPGELVAIVQISHQTHLLFAHDGTIISNRLGSSGLLEHYPVVGNQRVCHCGRTGCFGTVSSGSAVVQNYFELTGQRLDAAVDVIERIGRHDPDAIEAARSVTQWLAKTLVGLIRVFQPDRLVFTGAVGAPDSAGAQTLIDALRAELEDGFRDLPIDVVRPVIGSFGEPMAQLLLR